jgi:4-aminobutyrate aminotransferase
MKEKNIIEREKKAYPETFFIRFYPMIVAKAKGFKVWDQNGKEYLDFNASWAVANVGYSNERIINSFIEVYKEITALSLTTFSHEKSLELAEELIKVTPGSFDKKVIFGFSGSDANEAAYKVLSTRKGRFRIISFTGSYHGQTMGAYSMSGHPALSKIRGLNNIVKVPYPYCYRCPFNESYPGCSLACIEYIKHVMKTIAPPQTVSGVIVEPFQSDGGDILPPLEFMKELNRLCEENDIWLISDEVKVGLGRTGKIWGIENFDIIPDGLTIGKPLGSGLPISAFIAKSELFSPDAMHLFTLAGHPAIAAAALATIKIIIEEKLHENAKVVGEYFLKRLKELYDKYEIIGDVRGIGLIAGIELVKNRRSKEPAKIETAKIVYRLWQLGLLTSYVGIHSNVIELTPPLIISKKEVNEAIEKIDVAINDVIKGKVSDEEIKEYAGW